MTLSIASNRKFGVEIEFVGISMETAISVIADCEGVSLDRRNSGFYNHNDSTTSWKIVEDGSVSGMGGEAVSPILSGIEGLEQVRKVAEGLVAAGATANRSCGLHVHVDARDLEARDLANVVQRYAKFETEIDKYMPTSRRGAGNTYCRSIISVARNYRTQMESATTLSQVANCMQDRFQKVNVQSFNSHGSVEIRHHSGTCQAGKIIPWIQFCVNFVEKSIVQFEAAPAAPARRSVNSRDMRNNGFGVGTPRTGRARDSKTLIALHKIVNELDRVGYRGVSAGQLSVITGVKATSVVVYLSNLRTKYGFGIKKDRYRGTYCLRRNGVLPPLVAGVIGQLNQAPVPQTVPVVPVRVVVQNDQPLRGLPRSVTSYFSERVVDLAA